MVLKMAKARAKYVFVNLGDNSLSTISINTGVMWPNSWGAELLQLAGQPKVVIIAAKEVSFSWPFVCLLARLCKYYWSEKKTSEDGSWSKYDHVKFWEWSDSPSGYKKQNPDSLIYLLLCVLAEVCTLWELLYNLQFASQHWPLSWMAPTKSYR